MSSNFLCRSRQLALALVALATLVHTAATAEERKPEKVKFLLVGDSTVTDAAGWGAAFGKLLTSDAECVNAARGGASSKSYYDSGLWKKALEQKPAYVLIQFGHNDQPGKGPQRETDPKTTYREYLRKYVEEARAAGAKPVLVTSLVRRTFTPEGKINSSLAPYADAVNSLGKELKVPVVDLHARSAEFVERLGPEKAKELGPPHPTQADKFDGTHLNEQGAAATAPLIVKELLKVEPDLQKYLIDKPD
jgi:lysophospholipase L1-like esterase